MVARDRDGHELHQPWGLPSPLVPSTGLMLASIFPPSWVGFVTCMWLTTVFKPTWKATFSFVPPRDSPRGFDIRKLLVEQQGSLLSLRESFFPSAEMDSLPTTLVSSPVDPGCFLTLVSGCKREETTWLPTTVPTPLHSALWSQSRLGHPWGQGGDFTSLCWVN